ncbi:MAG: serine/threonine protein kinase [Planctomycetes bacterium]|nr:serine/threonine protein kinase [Planctomycetota bacterium]
MSSELPGYRITRQIGVGARSKISLATELSTGKTFAVKYVERESSEDDPFVGQVETEFEVSSNVSHPCLRQSFHIHRERKLLQTRRIWLVMEYIDGLNLEKARPNRLMTFLSLFRKVAQGLNAMHEAGFVHTDIKPTNIMIARGAAVKIIDFGQSCPIHHRKERIQGTPDYIAPEQVRRRPLDQRTDIFNLGATMYWVLTSEKYPTAIRGTDARGGINIITADKPIAPIELNDKIPLSLSKLIMECCRDNPHERPADMKQVVSRLEVVQRIWAKQREAHRAERMGDVLSDDSDQGRPTEESK